MTTVQAPAHRRQCAAIGVLIASVAQLALLTSGEVRRQLGEASRALAAAQSDAHKQCER